MVMVEIYIPLLDKRYDFRLDEHTQILYLLEDISEIICQKEQCRMDGDWRNLLLCHTATRRKLPLASTLSECGIKIGDSLLLV